MSNSDTTINKELPKEWEVVRLGDESIADLIMGQSPPSSTYNDNGIGLPFLQGNAEFGETYPAPILSCSQPIKIAEKNDILLSVRAPVGDINIASSKSCIGRGLAAIRPKSDKLNYFFLYYYLKFGSRKFESLSMGSTFKAIRKEEVVKFQISLPPLPEQRRIAEVLGTVDSAIQKVGGAIESTERLKRGLMQRLLTRGIGHERFKESEVGRMPEEWEVVRLGDILSLEYGKGLPENERTKGNCPVFGSNGIIGYHAQFLVKGTGIVVGRKGTIGAVTWVDSDFWPIDTAYFVKIKNDNVFLKWLFFKLNQSNLPRLSQSDVVPGLKRELVYHITIPLPPLSEQRRIAEILSAVDRKLELERRRKEKLKRVKMGLMNELLTGKKRIKVEAI